ncbi:hypothetical protein AURDEDRAFT_55566 [Auricularia subglabra TFB-10046 SS5]|nr:hypothetical protein AURDEDRAFT_55566 [Auricularia subglabra TFB-10046 SS5]
MKFLSAVAVLALALGALSKENSEVTELKIETTYKPEGCTQTAAKGDKIKVHYTGTLYTTGAKFDSSLSGPVVLSARTHPSGLAVGVGQVIKGWDEGLLGMCEGEKRVLTIPADKAYGSRGFGSVIPANSALVFDVEMVSLPPARQEL